jgi:hypothetical protein
MKMRREIVGRKQPERNDSNLIPWRLFEPTHSSDIQIRLDPSLFWLVTIDEHGTIEFCYSSGNGRICKCGGSFAAPGRDIAFLARFGRQAYRWPNSTFILTNLDGELWANVGRWDSDFYLTRAKSRFRLTTDDKLFLGRLIFRFNLQFAEYLEL